MIRMAAPSLALVMFVMGATARGADQTAGARVLFDGKSLAGWSFVPYGPNDRFAVWSVEDGMIVCHGHGGGWIRSHDQYEDFELTLEYRLTDGANSGIFIRAPEKGHISSDGIEIQIIDEHSPRYNDPKHPMYYKLLPTQRTGSVYGVQGPSETATKPAGEWNRMVIIAKGRGIVVRINDREVVRCDLDATPAEVRAKHPGVDRKGGYIGLSSHNDRVEFRNIRVAKF